MTTKHIQRLLLPIAALTLSLSACTGIIETDDHELESIARRGGPSWVCSDTTEFDHTICVLEDGVDLGRTEAVTLVSAIFEDGSPPITFGVDADLNMVDEDFSDWGWLGDGRANYSFFTPGGHFGFGTQTDSDSNPICKFCGIIVMPPSTPTCGELLANSMRSCRQYDEQGTRWCQEQAMQQWLVCVRQSLPKF